VGRSVALGRAESVRRRPILGDPGRLGADCWPCAGFCVAGRCRDNPNPYPVADWLACRDNLAVGRPSPIRAVSETVCRHHGSGGGGLFLAVVPAGGGSRLVGDPPGKDVRFSGPPIAFLSACCRRVLGTRKDGGKRHRRKAMQVQGTSGRNVTMLAFSRYTPMVGWFVGDSLPFHGVPSSNPVRVFPCLFPIFLTPGGSLRRGIDLLGVSMSCLLSLYLVNNFFSRKLVKRLFSRLNRRKRLKSRFRGQCPLTD